MLSWANESLIQDGRSQSDIRQGVTLEVMGEGDSMGPLNDAMKKEMRRAAGRHQIRDRVDDARRISRLPGQARRVLQRRVVRRRDHRARFTKSVMRIGRPRRTSWSGCRRWCGRRWKKARWASARR